MRGHGLGNRAICSMTAAFAGQSALRSRCAVVVVFVVNMLSHYGD